MTNAQQQKLDAFFAAIAAVKALGDGYQKMAYTLEDNLYTLQMEILADEKKQCDCEKDTYMKQCRIADVKADAEKHEKAIKARLKVLQERMNHMVKAGVRSGDNYYALQSEEIALMIELSDVWSKYKSLMSEK